MLKHLWGLALSMLIAANSFAAETVVGFKKPLIVYSSGYDISFFGIEKVLHHFDGTKYSKVFDYLKEKNLLEFDHQTKKTIHYKNVYTPSMVTDLELLEVHTQEYLDSLHHSKNVAKVTEIFELALVPNWLLQKKLLQPVKLATGGTILAAQLAMEHKTVAINLSGGYHHAKRDQGEGFCFFADIPLAIKSVRKKYGADTKVLVIDFDAHQGNGVSTILKDDEYTAIIDIYGKDIYPKVHRTWGDHQAITGKNFYGLPIPQGTSDAEYVQLIEQHLPQILDDFKPDLVIYNAGTDILAGDPLGAQNVSKEGIIRRDELVIGNVRKRNIPVVMVLSGGYTGESAIVIGRSIENIFNQQ